MAGSKGSQSIGLTLTPALNHTADMLGVCGMPPGYLEIFLGSSLSSN